MEEDNNQSTAVKQNPLMIAVVAGVLILGGIGFLLTRSGSGRPASGPAVEGVSEEVALAQEVRDISLEAGSFFFAPSEIRVKTGEKIRITLTAKDLMHDFNIDALGIKIPVTKSGESGVVEFTADTPGEFEYYCSVGQHRANGQVGKLIVE
ncbi:MAG: Plastocyanin [Candidatus Amesbacteria bacterium GW2011_GWA1_47_16]|uniref:EfeO-type cupredoxin-like domain-containing protein n=3 Tax=Candidatus Amesiibacteriota TaxID=1752730 RepID=A0A1F4ZYB1_9BACT|nr:MAG: Plastocyanin [Candidatus Amesbacteria bacterium GW2011_GWA1_47_16]OGD00911.1 MAG: hypothetical protein A2701_04790 [Candidatus Amesbacteria bacterium RIFCSPHIGHO2_01_FULL_47_34]OGD01064.1 MAG: hypothetical protein A2972_03070 [Candidatus Amesbacteria bacterium RIFCSPLOWO2_01_FULL_47_33]OGD10467.1 MAG: hypothetical protein A2395_01575 [Candidatus Amesbacteria bacterium RIFOXYB1_FULL_47_9]